MDISEVSKEKVLNQLKDITEQDLINLGFSTGTAYNIKIGKISSKSLKRLIDKGLVSFIPSERGIISSTNSLLGEYNLEVQERKLSIDSKGQILVVLHLVNSSQQIDIYYTLSPEDIINLHMSDIDILEVRDVYAHIVGNKIKILKIGDAEK